MVDLKGQYDKIKIEIDSAIQNVIDTSSFIKGNHVKEFQKELENFLPVKHVVACGNGTDALQIALMSLNLKPGDEVITSGFTFIATAEVIALLGLKPVLVDVDPNTFNLDVTKVEKAITEKTKAIIPVHLFGQCADMNTLSIIAKKHNLYLIEDAAQALGTNYYINNSITKKAGTIGDIGCTSFFPSKNLGCFGDGGAIFTNNDDLFQKISAIANHGMKKKYYHELIGVNSRLDNIQAAILRVKLKHLNEYNLARQKAADFYDKAFINNPKLQIPVRAKYSTHIFHQYTLLTKDVDREKIQDYLKSKNIPSMVYYPVPIHKQEAFKNYIFSHNDFPVTEDLCKRVISLPMHTELTEEQLNYIVDNVNEATQI
ncbi:MAG: DegT/DnrJ/EryC1/StrS family aminotransferase [Bacteroidetes bacterium]|nr:DegT/DnrJ/EryC1/StrS family aminotransferase [Bacteroidota bacterium]